MATNVRLPIKVVIPSPEDFVGRLPGGSGPKIFPGDLAEKRSKCLEDLDRIGDYFARSFRTHPRLPIVAKVTLHREALAKTHRPSALFSLETCPIFGAGRMGELFIAIRPRGLRALRDYISTGQSEAAQSALSTIDSIDPYTSEDVLGALSVTDLQDFAESTSKPLKFRLFKHDWAPDMDQVLRAALLRVASEQDLPVPEEIHYGKGLQIFRITEPHPDAIKPLAEFVGAQSIGPFPEYRLLDTAAVAVRRADPGRFPPPEAGKEYPVLGIVDSGIDETDGLLSPWIVGRESFVAAYEVDRSHGTFVAGLAIHPKRLNDERFPGGGVKLLDVVALPANGAISEEQLITILESVVASNPEVRVWNLSLAAAEPCDRFTFSHLAINLDELQDKHDVVFVLATGNYSKPPLRGWRPEDLAGEDRISPPADSVRGIAVGAIAHQDKPWTRVQKEQPAPFTRCGPGPAFLQKPDLSSYGGNCSAKLRYDQTGVQSLDGRGNITENIGTSFAAPAVSSHLATLNFLTEPRPSRNLLVALAVHSALLEGRPLDAEEMRYLGYGTPCSPEVALSCPPWATTLVFEGQLGNKKFEKRNFPIAECLRNPDGSVRAEIVMTLAYDPPLDAAFGMEYCRANVDISLGTYDAGKNGKAVQRKIIPLEPADIASLYEREQVEHGYKWSPLKVYRKLMNRQRGREWRLVINPLRRGEMVHVAPQNFALIVTVCDPDKANPSVYDQTLALMSREGWNIHDLQVRDRVRVEARS